MDNKPSYEEIERRAKQLEEELSIQKYANKILKDESERYKVLFDKSATASIIIEEDTIVSLVNPEFEDLTGFIKEEIEGLKFIIEFISDREKAKVIEYHCLRRMDIPLVPRTYETEILTKNGNIVPVYISESLVPGTKKSVANILDLSDLKETQVAFVKQRAYFRQLFENSPQAITIVDKTYKIIDVNKAFENLFGYKIDVIKGKMSEDIIVPEEYKLESKSFHQAMLEGKNIQKETYRMNYEGMLIPVSILGYPIVQNNHTEGFFLIFNDISEKKSFEQQLKHQAFHDSLTGIPNRILFIERILHAFERSKRRNEYNFSVLQVDIDRFKNVNERFGHLAGDNVLIEISNRFKLCLRTIDTVARIGGDEFAILVEEFSSFNEVIQIAKRIKSVIEQPFIVDKDTVHVSASIGIVLKTKYYQVPEDILRDAEISMHRTKKTDKGHFKVFNPKMYKSTIESLKIENDLRSAITNHELLLYYQPIISTNTQALEGFEALVRWKHPERGILSPIKFIPIAEESGLIIPLGQFIMIEGCKQMKEWLNTLPNSDNLTVNINVSSRQLMKKDFSNFVVSVLKASNLDPKHLKIELTESLLMQDSISIVEKLKQLKDLGIKLAIDDFGTGYSSLSYLQQFPIDDLKIDKSFIKGIAHEKESLEIVKTIINLAKNLGLSVIAEGVETKEQLKILKDIRCDKVQGYLFSKPIGKHSASILIKKMLYFKTLL
ncbi:MAG: GGDEF domain-containing protein [Desulfobacterales bacterium]|nr:GGDEF domain-containing protein [Desulfobacterales bacterium]